MLTSFFFTLNTLHVAVTVFMAIVGSAVLGDHTEVWTSFYDIYVRNALGSYLNVLKEGARELGSARVVAFV